MEHQQHKDHLEHNAGSGEAGAANKNILAGSIIMAAILISASLFYNTKLLVQTFNGDLGNNRLQGLSQNSAEGGSIAQPQTGQPAQDIGPVSIVQRNSAPVIGNKNAKITFTEFSDFQCPFCKQFFDESLPQIMKNYVDTGKMKIVFRHFPLPFHQNAQKAGEAAECANIQGKFKAYHDLLFKNSQSDGTGLAIADLKKYADQLGLNKGTLGFRKNQFNECLDNGATAEIVKTDIANGNSAGVSGTPTLFINGNKIVGAQPYANFEQAIEAELKK